MNRFLVATDGSPAAEAAVEAGVQLAEEQGAKVVFLHVVDPYTVIAAPLGPLTALPAVVGDPEDDPVLAQAAEVASEHDVPFELRLVAGFERDAILATADQIDAELIAVGSNRHGALGTVLLGSVSRSLVSRAQRPVLVVHPTRMPVEAAAS
jgi:nucleotide-binding universal stress UspA family protein